MKRKLFVTITLLTTICVLSGPQLLAYNVEIDGLFYKFLDDSTVSVAKYPSMIKRYTGDIKIPATIEYANRLFTVRGIEDEAFFGSPVNEIILPNTIEFIGREAFMNSDISSIIIPPSVRQIGNECFSGTRHLKSIWFQASDTPISMHTHSWGYCSDWEEYDISIGYEHVSAMFRDSAIDLVIIEREYDVQREIMDCPEFRYEYESPKSWERLGYGPFVTAKSISRVEIRRNLKSRWIAPNCNPVKCLWLSEDINEIAINWPDDYTNIFSLNPTPPVVLNPYKIQFSHAYSKNLYVPTQSIEAYKNDSYWGQFVYIRSIEDAVEGVVEDGSQPFVISGNRITFDADVDGYTLYDINGNIVSTGDGNSDVEVETHGIHILHVNNRAFKILF